MGSSIDALMKTEWFDPASKAYAQYLEANRRLKCLGESISFENFAREIMATPPHRRDELLNISAPDAKELELACLQKQPAVSYGQYISPTQKEQILGLSGKKPKKRS